MGLEESETDGGLLAGAKAGDKAALGRLLKMHGPQVRATLDINSKWQSVLEADDVMQVTYLEAFEGIKLFDGGPAAFEGWLRRIAQNNLRDAIEFLEREKRPQPQLRVGPHAGDDSIVWLYEFLTASGTTPTGKVSRDDCRAILEAEIDLLPEDYARVLRAVYFDGKAVGEVAESMERTKGAVHLLRIRAEERLRRRLGSGSQFLSR